MQPTEPDGPREPRSVADDEEQMLINIIGERVALGPLRMELLPEYRRWTNAFSTQRTGGFLAMPRPWTAEMAANWYEQASTGEHRVWFTIYAVDDWRPIGYCNLRDIDFQHRTAEFGLTIGEESDRGRGYGTEATRLLMDYAFTALGLNNLWLDVFEFNRAGRGAYEKAGFREIGRRRKAYQMGGRLWDVIFMDCLASEFTSPVLGRVFVGDEER